MEYGGLRGLIVALARPFTCPLRPYLHLAFPRSFLSAEPSVLNKVPLSFGDLVGRHQIIIITLHAKDNAFPYQGMGDP